MVGGEGAITNTEIVSLTEGSTIPECLNALSDHPNFIYYAAGGALPDAGKVKAFVVGSDSQNSIFYTFNTC